jgi:acetate---CoA ligase (ADP-forming)
VNLPAGSGPLAEYESKEILRHCGFSLPLSQLVTTADDAVAFAQRLGRPVVMKTQSRQLIHKTEFGGVELNLSQPGEIRAAFAALIAAAQKADPTATVDGVLVEAMAAKGPEFILGMHNDPQFGPVVMLGIGGTFAELIADRALRMPPIGAADAREMLDELKSGRKLLDGFRDLPKCDESSLIAAMAALADFVTAHRDRLDSIDINPLRMTGDSALVLDATIVLR